MNCSAVKNAVWGMIARQPYASDVSEAEWRFVVPYLCLLPEDAG